MEASTSNDPDVKTFRGRSLEELLPQIQSTLPEDLVIRQFGATRNMTAAAPLADIV